MQHYLTRTEVAIVVAALAVLVVGVSLAAIPPTAPVTRTAVQAVISTSPNVEASPTPPPPASPAPAAVAVAPAQTPSPAAPTAPITVSGPAHLQPWQRGVYDITFNGVGRRDVAIWWSGAAMSDWTISLVSGHAELTNSQDRFAGWVKDRTVIELDLVPDGWPGGQLVIQGTENGGAPLGLAVVQVANHS